MGDSYSLLNGNSAKNRCGIYMRNLTETEKKLIDETYEYLLKRANKDEELSKMFNNGLKELLVT